MPPSSDGLRSGDDHLRALSSCDHCGAQALRSVALRSAVRVKKDCSAALHCTVKLSVALLGCEAARPSAQRSAGAESVAVTAQHQPQARPARNAL